MSALVSAKPDSGKPDSDKPDSGKPENISNLLAMDEEYAAPDVVARNVIQKDWLGECARARKDPEAFWGEYAKRFVWSRKWDRVMEWDGVHHQWFTGAKTNITNRASGGPSSRVSSAVLRSDARRRGLSRPYDAATARAQIGRAHV